MKKYRQLEPHEIIRVGDAYWCDATDTINPDTGIGIIVKDSNDGAGKPADYSGNYHFRPIKEDNWIAFSERKPTKEDASREGKIIFYRGDATPIRIENYNYEPLDETYRKYWMPLNFVPREPVRIKVDGHEVIPNKDGSIKVGCQTVASKDFEEIIRQRQEVMK